MKREKILTGLHHPNLIGRIDIDFQDMYCDVIEGHFEPVKKNININFHFAYCNIRGVTELGTLLLFTGI